MLSENSPDRPSTLARVAQRLALVSLLISSAGCVTVGDLIHDSDEQRFAKKCIADNGVPMPMLDPTNNFTPVPNQYFCKEAGKELVQTANNS